MNNHVTVLEIDGKALEHNLNYFKGKLQTATKVLAVVKAFGYGSDGVQVARFLEHKVDYFAVAYTHEGVALREAGVQTPILVLHPHLQNLQAIIDFQLEPGLYNFTIFNAFLKLTREKSLDQYPVHLKFNTGLNRLGFSAAAIPEILMHLKAPTALKIQSLFSHLAASEDAAEKVFTSDQIEQFTAIKEAVCAALAYTPMLHLLNTSGVVNYPQAQFDMVRIGIGLYGFGNDKKETAQLKNTHNLKSIISQIHPVAPGETVGYNRAFAAKSATKTATIPIGHADGLSRRLGNTKGFVRIQNQDAPIIGNVCMDMIMVDVTHIDCNEGDAVIVFNTQEMIQHIADISETIVYETLTAISPRVHKTLKT